MFTLAHCFIFLFIGSFVYKSSKESVYILIYQKNKKEKYRHFKFAKVNVQKMYKVKAEICTPSVLITACSK